MCKLMKDVCRKTAFSFANITFEEMDGVSMESSLAPILANIMAK